MGTCCGTKDKDLGEMETGNNEEDIAATKIQARFRGNQQRKKMKVKSANPNVNATDMADNGHFPKHNEKLESMPALNQSTK